MFRSEAVSTHPICSVRRHPLGGFTPVLHLSDRPAPPASPHGAQLPSIDAAVRHAREQHGLVFVLVHQECAGATAA